MENFKCQNMFFDQIDFYLPISNCIFRLPLAEIMLICGFLMIYVTEELAHVLLDKLRNKNAGEIETKVTTHLDHEAEIPTEVLMGEASFQTAFRGFFIVLAISLHAVFEGIALGLGKKASFIWYLCFAVAAHKFIISFCVGLQVSFQTFEKLSA